MMRIGFIGIQFEGVNFLGIPLLQQIDELLNLTLSFEDVSQVLIAIDECHTLLEGLPRTFLSGVERSH